MGAGREKGTEFERESGTGTEREPEMSFVIRPWRSKLRTRVETGIGTCQWRVGVEKETERGGETRKDITNASVSASG